VAFIFATMLRSYQETIEYLYAQLAVYHLIGPQAYKADLTNTLELCQLLDNPQTRFKTVHVAGTNGKGSSSHMLAAIFQAAGYKTGLYTSPHLKDFSERIKINGQEINHDFVVAFTAKMEGPIQSIKPSFFELTVAMAFEYFALNQVDVAIIEVGLGGRLDSTNIIQPELSLITNIGYDHMDILGNTLPEIAFEKAGIIKHGTPVVVSERQSEVASVFLEKAKNENAPIGFAADYVQIQWMPNGQVKVQASDFSETLKPQLKGAYQSKNIAGVIAAALKLREGGWKILNAAIAEGINHVVDLTGLKGRWQIIRHKPLVVCDTGHNAEGIQELIKQIKQTQHRTLRWVFGVVKDKNPDRVLSILPKDAQYYFCRAKIQRALDAGELNSMAQAHGLNGEIIPDVNEALNKATADSAIDDLIMVGGSTFVVAEVSDL
jgi:dihydrofolate synthase/folylpolyglutamate synthase